MQIKNKHRYNGPGIYCGRPSPLGNPFREGVDGTRDQVIEKYRVWLWKQMSKPGEIGSFQVMQALAELKRDSILICWCAPKRCHCEIIIRAWKYAKKEGLI